MAGFGMVVWWALIAVQVLCGAAEIFRPESVLRFVVDDYVAEPKSGAAVAIRNLGLYNWFLAGGLLLGVFGVAGAATLAWFFAACVAIAGAFALASVTHEWPNAVFFWVQLILGLAGVLLLRHSQ